MRRITTLRTAVVLASTSLIVLTSCSADQVEQAVNDGVDKAQQVASEASEKASEAFATAKFCKAAYDVADAVNDEDWNRAVAEGENLVAEAPDEIRPQSETVLDGARRYVDGDQSAVAHPQFRAAAEDVRAYAEEHCDPR